MVDLKAFTLKDLKSIAQTLGWTSKQRTIAGIITEIQNKQISEPKLEEAIKTLNLNPAGKPKTSSKNVSARTTNVAASGIESRITQLENQIHFIMDKISSIEARIGSGDRGAVMINRDQLKALLLRLIPSGKAILIDDLFAHAELRGYSFQVVEKILLDLIDEAIFDVSDGSSKLKLQGNIGLLIRR